MSALNAIGYVPLPEFMVLPVQVNEMEPPLDVMAHLTPPVVRVLAPDGVTVAVEATAEDAVTKDSTNATAMIKNLRTDTSILTFDYPLSLVFRAPVGAERGAPLRPFCVDIPRCGIVELCPTKLLISSRDVTRTGADHPRASPSPCPSAGTSPC